MRSRAQTMLGLSAVEAKLLTDSARRRLGGWAYGTRAAAFMLATAPVIRRLMPKGIRRRAIRPYVWSLIPGHPETLLYAVGDKIDRGAPRA